LSNILLILFLSSLFLMNTFGIGPNLYPLRLVLPITFVFFSISLFQKAILLKRKISVQPVIFFSLLFFLYMFFHTYLISFFRHNLQGYIYELNSIWNYTFLIALILSFYSVYLSNRESFFKFLNAVTLVFYLLYGFYAIYEIYTGNHLSSSDLFDAPYWLRHSPTAVYFNSNDFASVFTLMLMYLLSVFDKEKSLSIVRLLIIFCFHFTIIYFSQSRISLVISIFYFVYRYPIKLIYSSLIGTLVLIVGISFLEPNWYVQFLDSIKELKTDLLFSDRQSTSIRLYLYKYSLSSIFSSYGLGYGVDYSLQYFQSINDPNLSHIVNPHSFIFEILINSGLLAFLAYIGLNFYMLCINWLNNDFDLFIQILLFNLLLFSSSSSLFIWTIYLFIFIYICKTAQHQIGFKK
jgi:teichuronic acid biosynthesis protein TuaE